MMSYNVKYTALKKHRGGIGYHDSTRSISIKEFSCLDFWFNCSFELF